MTISVTKTSSSELEGFSYDPSSKLITLDIKSEKYSGTHIFEIKGYLTSDSTIYSSYTWSLRVY